jgi:hypothetical protein
MESSHIALGAGGGAVGWHGISAEMIAERPDPKKSKSSGGRQCHVGTGDALQRSCAEASSPHAEGPTADGGNAPARRDGRADTTLRGERPQPSQHGETLRPVVAGFGPGEEHLGGRSHDRHSKRS